MPKNKYRANWRVSGVTERSVAPGAHVHLEAHEAQHLVSCGALVLVESGEGQNAGDTPESTSTQSKPQDGLQTMKKAELVTFAKAQYGLVLDINRTKDELLASIAERAAQ